MKREGKPSAARKPSLWDNNPIIPQNLLKRGSVERKIAVRVDARTIIFLKPGTDKEKAVERYRNHIAGFHYLDASGNNNTKKSKN